MASLGQRQIDGGFTGVGRDMDIQFEVPFCGIDVARGGDVGAVAFHGDQFVRFRPLRCDLKVQGVGGEGGGGGGRGGGGLFVVDLDVDGGYSAAVAEGACVGGDQAGQGTGAQHRG